MQSLPSSTRNSLKLSSNMTLSSTICESNVPTSQLTFADPGVQALKNEKNYYKSRIRTGLTPRIERRGMISDCISIEIDGTSPRTSIPSKDYRSHTGLLNEGIHIRKLSVNFKNETGEKLKKYIQKVKEKETRNSVGCNDVMSEILDPNTPFRDSFLIVQKSKISIFEFHSRSKRECKTSLKKVPAQSDVPVSAFTTQIHRKNPQKIEKASIRDAIRDKDWIGKAKPQITKSLFSCLNRSNGMEMVLPTDSFFYYKYYLGKGNNSNLIKQCLSSRWWWTRVGEDDISSANLVWTQWKDKKTLASLQKIATKHVVDSTLAMTVTTNARYHPTDSHLRPKLVDITGLGYNFITRSKSFATLKTSQYQSASLRIHNKIEHNFHLSNKKALFFNLKTYYEIMGLDVFNVIPVTFHITNYEDTAYVEFENCFKNYEELTDELGRKPANLWIVKPGENSNRGNGITVCNSLDQIKSELKSNPHPKTGKHTFIIQKYIEKPFLINKRKFDIRCFSLVTCLNGVLQAYFFSEGYLRTASKAFSLQVTNKFIHLTNDAVQKHSDDYGKFESGNKMSYTDFQRYIDNHNEKSVSFTEEVLPQIKLIVKHTVEAVVFKLDPNARAHSFEVFGYDFLIDSDLKPWLLEVNTNPCLELSSPHLARIIPSMIENAFRICLDPVFQEPPSHLKHMTSPNASDLPENKFELIFHSVLDGEKLIDKFRNSACLDQNEIEELSNEADDVQDSDSEET